MFKRILQIFTLLLMLIFTGFVENESEMVTETVVVEMKEYTHTPIETIKVKTIVKPPDEVINLSKDDIQLIALITMAEAEGECEEGKRLVIDTILNRLDSEHFPDTVSGVIYQKNQYSCVWSDRINKCYVQNDICKLVEDELRHRTDSDVIFFQTTNYSIYGTPKFKVGNHYFSSY